MRALFDVNMLIAMLDASHDFHKQARAWWAKEKDSGWASCAITENGMIRVMMGRSYSATHRFTAEGLIKVLNQFVDDTDHDYWKEELSFRDTEIFTAERVHDGRQLTDLHLLALAASRKGRRVTFDQNISVSLVKTAEKRHICVLH